MGDIPAATAGLLGAAEFARGAAASCGAEGAVASGEPWVSGEPCVCDGACVCDETFPCGPALGWAGELVMDVPPVLGVEPALGALLEVVAALACGVPPQVGGKNALAGSKCFGPDVSSPASRAPPSADTAPAT